MSIEIYNSYRIWSDQLDDVVKEINKDKIKIKKDLYQLVLKDIFDLTMKVYDTNILMKTCCESNFLDVGEETIIEGKELEKSSLQIAVNILKNTQLKEVKEYIELKIYIFPTAFEENGRKYYLFSYRGEEDLKKAYIKSLKNVEKYDYWNNSEKPSNIKQQQWEKRESDWNNAIPSGLMEEDGITSVIGRCKNQLLIYDDEDRKLIENYFNEFEKINNKEKRIKKYIDNIMLERIYKKITENEGEIAPFKMLSYYNKANRMYLNESLTIEEQKFKEEMENKVRSVITKIDYNDIVSSLEEKIEESKKIYWQYKLNTEMAEKTNEKKKHKI